MESTAEAMAAKTAAKPYDMINIKLASTALNQIRENSIEKLVVPT